MERCTLREAARKLARETAVPGVAASLACQATVTKKSKAFSPLGFVLHGIDSAHPYLAARGIESATASIWTGRRNESGTRGHHKDVVA
jgi:hypothetical protein